MKDVAVRAPQVANAEALKARVRAEFREMPGLCLTLQQACRLWQIDADRCTRILDVLVAESFLRRTATGAFIAGSLGPSLSRRANRLSL